MYILPLQVSLSSGAGPHRLSMAFGWVAGVPRHGCYSQKMWRIKAIPTIYSTLAGGCTLMPPRSGLCGQSEPDFREAQKWYTLAAESGNAQAQNATWWKGRAQAPGAEYKRWAHLFSVTVSLEKQKSANQRTVKANWTNMSWANKQMVLVFQHFLSFRQCNALIFVLSPTF